MRLKIKLEKNQKFGRWTYINDSQDKIVSNKKVRMVLCKCDCGVERNVTLYGLRNGTSLSCGCLQKEITKKMMYRNGTRKNKEYTTWQGMKLRCYYTKHISYKNYGGRGIRVCDRWLNSFENFLQDMGERPLGTTLDRIDVNGNYEPNNCRWATPKEQANNRR